VKAQPMFAKWWPTTPIRVKNWKLQQLRSNPERIF